MPLSRTANYRSEVPASEEIRYCQTQRASAADVERYLGLAHRRMGLLWLTTVLRVSYVTNVLEHDFYNATTKFAGREEQYGPLFFLDVCPQPPDSQGQVGNAEA